MLQVSSDLIGLRDQHPMKLLLTERVFKVRVLQGVLAGIGDVGNWRRHSGFFSSSVFGPEVVE
jgi:hypothetical protein